MNFPFRTLGGQVEQTLTSPFSGMFGGNLEMFFPFIDIV